jgi:hypothetical protein
MTSPKKKSTTKEQKENKADQLISELSNMSDIIYLGQ